jgi:hypothetical protein
VFEPLALLALVVFFAAGIYLLRAESVLHDPQLRRIASVADWTTCILVVGAIALTFVATKNGFAMGVVIVGFAAVPLRAVLNFELKRIDSRRGVDSGLE